MECSCDISVEVDVYPEFYIETNRKARKVHKCTECRRDILPKETYMTIAGKWDGVIQTYKHCADCQSIITQFFSSGFTFGEVLWLLADAISEGGGLPEKCVSKLTPRAREKVCDMIQKYWDEKEE